MLSMKKNMVTTIIQAVLIASMTGVLSPSIGSTLPEITPRAMLTTWVRGRIAIAIPCAAWGRRDRGKKVPQRKNIGVRKRKDG